MGIKISKFVFIPVIVLLIVSFLPIQVKAFQMDDSFYMHDSSNHWAEEDLSELAYMGILKGDNNQNFNPEKSISRAEFIALLVRALDYNKEKVDTNPYFKDVNEEDWYYQEVTIAKEQGITQGNGNGLFLPENNITREEIVLMLVRAIGLNSSGPIKAFNDISNSYQHKAELNAAIQSKIINGYEDNTFRPYQKASRAEAAVMMKRIINIKKQPQDNEKEQINTIIKEYLHQYIEKKNMQDSNIAYNLSNSIGKEHSDNQTKAEIIELYKEIGVEVEEHIKNTDIQITDITDKIAKAVVKYDATYNRTFDDNSKRTKTYMVEKKIGLKKIAGEWKIYNSEDRLYSKEKLNLVWEQISVQTPDMSGIEKMEGLDIISPTWFELRTKDSKISAKANDPIVLNDNQGSIQMADLGDLDFIEWAHQNDYDVWALYRNEFDIEVANRVLNSEEARKDSIALLVKYADKYKLDGINVDFENVYYKDKDKFSQYVRELSLVLREQGLITSVDVTKIEPTSWTWSMFYDRKALGKAVDYMMLMAYDQNGSWSKQSGSVAQYTWVEKSLQGVMKQVPNEKLLLGLPFYTRVWEEVNSNVVKSTAISMEKAQSLISENNANVVWDEQSGQYLATYYMGLKTYKIWLEDAESIKLKSSLVHKYELAGVASWRRGYETHGIWAVLNQNLKEHKN